MGFKKEKKVKEESKTLIPPFNKLGKRKAKLVP